MDARARLTERERDRSPLAALTALTRKPALRAAPPCQHCGRDRSAVEVACCEAHDWSRIRRHDEPWSPKPTCNTCNGTGRTEWPWHGPGGRLALMAYAGDEAARALVSVAVPAPLDLCDCGCPHSEHELGGLRDGFCRLCSCARYRRDRMTDWLRGLDRWPAPVLLFAEIAAGRAVAQSWRRDEYNVLFLESRIEPALDAAAEHALCLCAESRNRWMTTGNWETQPVWVPHPFGDRGAAFGWADSIQSAAREVDDEATIRAAVRSALVRFGREGLP